MSRLVFTFEFREKYFDDAITFSACFNEITIIQCTMVVWDYGDLYFMWSMTAATRKTQLIDVRPGTLVMNRGLGSTVATQEGSSSIPNSPCCSLPNIGSD